jgi:alpha-L-fucosidase 2
MVFGGTASERIQINEDTVWAGEKRERSNPEGKKNLAEVRRLLFTGKPKEAEVLAEKTMIAVPKRMPPYQPLGDLLLTFVGHDRVSDYFRELDIDSAVSRASYVAGGARYDREIFASAVDGVIAIRITCDKPSALSFSATLVRQQDSSTKVKGNSRVVIEGEAIARGDRHTQERKVGAKFCGMLDVVAGGGRVSAQDDKLFIENANTATLLFTAATNVRQQDPAANCRRVLAEAKRKAYARLRADHIADHRRFFRRVVFDLGATRSDLPTDERLKRVQNGETDLDSRRCIFNSDVTS